LSIFDTTKNNTNLTFTEFVETIPEARNIGVLEQPWRIPRLARYLEEGEVIRVKNATVENTLSAHAYVLESKNETVSIQWTAPVDNNVDDVSSNMAESCSVVATVTLATTMAYFHELVNVTLTIYCDNDEAIRHFGHSTEEKNRRLLCIHEK